MRNETDLRQVKSTACAMRMLDIGEIDFSPMIVDVPFCYRSFLGYRNGADGKPEIDEEQAVIGCIV